MFGKLGDMHGMMKQAAEIGRQMKQMHEELAEKRVEAVVGAGLVKVTANGRGEVITVEVDPELMRPEERETLQELILAGVNEAVKKAKDLARGEMAKLTGGIDVPGMLGISEDIAGIGLEGEATGGFDSTGAVGEPILRG